MPSFLQTKYIFIRMIRNESKVKYHVLNVNMLWVKAVSNLLRLHTRSVRQECSIFSKHHLKKQEFKEWTWNLQSRYTRTRSCHGIVKSVWPSDDIWWHTSSPKLFQAMACCLTEQSQCLNRCWLQIIGIHHSPILQKMRKIYWQRMSSKPTFLKIFKHAPADNGLVVSIYRLLSERLRWLNSIGNVHELPQSYTKPATCQNPSAICGQQIQSISTMGTNC